MSSTFHNPMRPSEDVVGFRRIFVLFCALVLLPAMLMSGFGIVAILNERQANKQRRREVAEEELRRLESRWVSLLSETDGKLAESPVAHLTDGDKTAASAHTTELAQHLRREHLPLGPIAVFDQQNTLLFVENDISKNVVSLAGLVNAVTMLKSGERAHIQLDGGASVFAVQRLQNQFLIAYLLDRVRLEESLQYAMTRQNEQDEQAGRKNDALLEMRAAVLQDDAAKPVPVVDALSRLMEEMIRLQNKPRNDDNTEVLTSRRLAVPFDAFTLAVEAPPHDGFAPLSIFYLVLLLIFYAILAVGVVLTARLIWQETRLSRLKTDFVSHISHEMRTPLTSIRMFIETLQMGRASPDEEQECLQLLSQETARLSEMIERVLRYARLRAGRQRFQPSLTTVDELVEDALSAFRAHLVGHNLASTATEDANAATQIITPQLSLTVDVPKTLPPILVDPQAVVEVLINLVGNAYKYTGADKKITVSAYLQKPVWRWGKQTERVVIAVADNGPGLPKSEHRRIFERFYQTGALLSSKNIGSGLGLAIAKAIVEANHGTIAVESEPEAGATFSVAFRAVHTNENHA